MRKAKTPAKRKPGRPATGKRSSGHHSQHSVWVENKLFARVVDKLLTDHETGKRGDFSELIETLLTAALRGK